MASDQGAFLSAGGYTVGRLLISEEDLQARIRALGEEITSDYAGRAPLLVGVLKGAFMFMSDLSRAIDLPVEFDFMAVSSYGHSTRSSGVVRIVKDLDIDLADRDVIIVEDIIDSGLTLNYLRRNLLARNPASLEVCALLVRENHRVDAAILRYEGFRVPSDFLVGYGLDVNERFRNLSDIRVVTAASDAANDGGVA
ncbi:MAG TPA: hypoxanthine phosphoribosyltransferase [Acidimicrobiaceae bacterium]|jgi:hypoxanthine phosphoribosyltransferase|nr:hypoxanthine phosphoribosyltransferase [Acidimicrobiaceae bacterium]HBA94942.1 hypoxanthine phosphoribosyltransferase [Acidimicrobiaceae bacterium]HIE67287.1 hypoxanthine phosphoribosyltransferase [Acidimicrobiia bacterium]HIL48257.1 hypoxanthine phosphoribosyltransferase [Acidimicrobiia bacterium]|tara:strand:+ start:805 stop:1395 length:591 start_codon:yes stop_codon:yes gene_type:complete